MIVEGNNCPKGLDFADKETSNPTRTLTTTVRTKFPDVPVISVRTAGEIPKNMLTKAMHELNEVIIEEELGCGDTVLEDVADTGVSVIVTSSALMQLGAELENRNVSLSSGATSSGSASAVTDGAIGTVRNSDILDEIGGDSVGGFVGAAGEAVGVEDEEFEEEYDEDGGTEGEGRIKPKGRPHIKRR